MAVRPRRQRSDPDGYSLDGFYMARPGSHEVQLDLLRDYASNHAVAHKASSDQTSIMAVVQRPIALQCIEEPAPTPAWKTTQSWFLLAEELCLLREPCNRLGEVRGTWSLSVDDAAVQKQLGDVPRRRLTSFRLTIGSPSSFATSRNRRWPKSPTCSESRFRRRRPTPTARGFTSANGSRRSWNPKALRNRSVDTSLRRVSSTSPWPDKEQAMKVLQVDVLDYPRQRKVLVFKDVVPGVMIESVNYKQGRRKPT